MSIDGKSALIVVTTEWSERKGIRRLLGATSSGRPAPSGTEHYIIVRVVSADEPRGLWIELNTKKRMADPIVPRHHMLIPWGAILSLVFDPDQPDQTDELTALWNLGEPGGD